MKLTLSTKYVRNAIFTNDSGQVVYKSTSPRVFGTKSATLHKIKPNEDPADMRDHFEAIGEIKWRLVGSSTLRLHGEEMLSKEFIPAHGIDRRKRKFTGPDGCPYRWDMGRFAVVLIRDDASQTEVARYRRRTLGIIGPKQKGLLVIDPSVEHMIDLIVLTFVFVEKIRIDKEK